jgi:hypothetical protein
MNLMACSPDLEPGRFEPGNGEAGVLWFEQESGPRPLAVGVATELEVARLGKTPWHCTHVSPCAGENLTEVIQVRCDGCEATVVGRGRVRVLAKSPGAVRLHVAIAGTSSAPASEDSLGLRATEVDELRVIGDEVDRARQQDRVALVTGTALPFRVFAFGRGEALDVPASAIQVSVTHHADYTHYDGPGYLPPAYRVDGVAGRHYRLVVSNGDGEIRAALNDVTTRLRVEGVAPTRVRSVSLTDITTSQEVRSIELGVGQRSGAYELRCTLDDGTHALGTAAQWTHIDRSSILVEPRGAFGFGLLAGAATDATLRVEVGSAFARVPIRVR